MDALTWSMITGAYIVAGWFYLLLRDDVRELRRELHDVHANDLKHLEERIRDLEQAPSLRSGEE